MGKDSSLRKFNADTLIRRRQQQLREHHGRSDVGSTTGVQGWFRSLRQYLSSTRAVHLQLGLLELAVCFLPMLGAQLYLLVRPIAAAGGVLPVTPGRKLRRAVHASAPVGDDEIEEAEGVEEVLAEIGLKAKGLLHHATAARRVLGQALLIAMHAVFPEGTLVRRPAQQTKKTLRRVVSWVFQGVSVEYARQPVRQYSVEHDFRSADEQALEADDVAPAGEEEEQEEPRSQIGKFLRRRQGGQAGTSSQGTDSAGVAAEPVLRTPAQHGTSGRQVGRAGPLGGSPPGTPTGSVSTRTIRAAKEAAKRSIAALAAGQDVTSLRNE